MILAFLYMQMRNFANLYENSVDLLFAPKIILVDLEFY